MTVVCLKVDRKTKIISFIQNLLISLAIRGKCDDTTFDEVDDDDDDEVSPPLVTPTPLASISMSLRFKSIACLNFLLLFINLKLKR